MSLPFMPMYWGDYWRDTNHLSDAEHVSYLKLISHYWTHGLLPNDDARLARIAGRSIEEWTAMKPMLQAFFKQGWMHSRIDRELIRQRSISESNSQKARKAASVRWCGMLQASVEQSSANANQSHSHNHNQILESEGKKETETRARRASGSVDIDFEKTFWPEWPNKVGKPVALKAWAAARKRGHTVETIMDGLATYIHDKPPDRPWLNPSTFLNQDRFLDRPAKVQQAGKVGEQKETLSQYYARLAMEGEEAEQMGSNILQLKGF